MGWRRLLYSGLGGVGDLGEARARPSGELPGGSAAGVCAAARRTGLRPAPAPPLRTSPRPSAKPGNQTFCLAATHIVPARSDPGFQACCPLNFFAADGSCRAKPELALRASSPAAPPPGCAPLRGAPGFALFPRTTRSSPINPRRNRHPSPNAHPYSTL